MITTAELSPNSPRYTALRRVIPQRIIDHAVRWRLRLRLLPNYFYDAKRYAMASAMGAAPRNEIQYSAMVTMAYHQLEKGLSLPEPRPFFGKEPLQKLFALLDRFAGDYPDCDATTAAFDALQAYIDWHRQRGLASPMLENVESKLQQLGRRHGRSADGRHSAVLHVDRPPSPVDSAVREHMFAGRRSIRDFGPDDVPLEMIEEAVRLALNAPSVCNRQGWRLRCLHDRTTIDRALQHQNGNRGFGHTVNRLLVVTSTLGSFVYPGERNEGWIDGGLFAMSLMLALHSLGLATCPLNWNHGVSTDRAFRREFDVPDEEIVIMFIAVGHYKPSYSVCGSPRVPVDRVLSFVDGPTADACIA